MTDETDRKTNKWLRSVPEDFWDVAVWLKDGWRPGSLDVADRKRIAERLIADLLLQVWYEGYEACERDERRVRECPGSSGCDCSVLTRNPYEEDFDLAEDSPCASGCKPSEGNVCGGPRCT